MWYDTVKSITVFGTALDSGRVVRLSRHVLCVRCIRDTCCITPCGSCILRLLGYAISVNFVNMVNPVHYTSFKKRKENVLSSILGVHLGPEIKTI